MKMKESTSPNYTIIEVWNNNLDEEFKKIRKIVQKYPYVAMVKIKSIILNNHKKNYLGH